MNYDPFVLPFAFGMTILVVILVAKYICWISRIEQQERRRILSAFFSWKFFAILREIFLEALLHRRVFKKNIRLGYMHASIACGWFLLIIAGSVESKMLLPSGPE